MLHRKEIKMQKHIFTVDTHTMGEPTRIVLAGMGRIAGKTMSEKRDYCSRHYDHYRTILMHEPRGHRDMLGAILTEPVAEEAEFGVIFMDSGGYLNMCVHGTIGIITAALEIGIIDVENTANPILIDTPAGIVKTTVNMLKNEVTEVSVTGIPSFMLYDAVDIKLPGSGSIPIDIAFGGSFFAIVESRLLGLAVVQENLPKLVDVGMRIKTIINDSIKVNHPTLDHIQSVDLVEITEESADTASNARNIVVFGNGQFDRSPCGTGTCAKMATLYAKNRLKLGQWFINESIIGTTFKGRLIEETSIGALRGVVPEITGCAYITGIQHFIVHPNDILGRGFLVQSGN